MKVFLTGGTGFLGAHIREELAAQGIDYVSLSRSPQSDATFVQGDLLRPETYIEHLQDCDAFIHAAGEVQHDADAADWMWNIHVGGAKAILEAIKQSPIQRLIYLSTSGTIGVSEEEDIVATEDSPSPFSLVKEWPYYRAKMFAEQHVLEEAPEQVDVVCLNPSLFLGPNDTKRSSTKSIQLFLDDQLPLSPAGGLSFADVRDVAKTVVTALEKGRSGERYLLSGCNLLFHDFYKKIARISGKNPPLAPMPKKGHKIFGWFPKWKNIGESVGLDLKRSDLILAAHYWYVDSSKAEAELGWSPRDPLRTLEDTVFYMQQDHFADFID
ncbi:MAG: NAD-dependent epimerase/dehydratase family protein [Myxococcota bacterium]|nr:NAD-dependent epimerase/dehydratase family protein [Myxococcota bacterium]